MLVSLGPIELGPLESARVAFATRGGENLAVLIATGESSQSMYRDQTVSGAEDLSVASGA